MTVCLIADTIADTWHYWKLKLEHVERRLLQSLLATSHGRPIHLIFITDSSSIATIVRWIMLYILTGFTFPLPDTSRTLSARFSLRESSSTLKPWIQTGSRFQDWGSDFSNCFFYLGIAFDSMTDVNEGGLLIHPLISPPLRVEFVSQASILHQHRQTIDHMRIHFDNHQQWMK